MNLDDMMVRRHVEAFDAALIRADYERLASLVSTGFTMVNPLAQRLRKDEWLAWIAREIQYHRINRASLEYRVFTGAVIVTSDVRSLMSVVGLNGGAPSEHHTFRTEVWVIAGDDLRLEHVQLTRIND